MAVPCYLLNSLDLLTYFSVSAESLLKLLDHVEVKNQSFVSVGVKFGVWKLFRVAPVDALNKPNCKDDQTEETIFDVKQVLLC